MEVTTGMESLAVVLEAPGALALRRLELLPLGSDDVVVEIDFSGISTGTERLLWSGRMPSFPGMGYPLVPGYESVGRIVRAAGDAEARVGERVFVPGATCYLDARGLFGGSARHIIVPGARAIPVSESLAERGALLALAATALHAVSGGQPADLIVGHGVLGRLIARMSIAAGGAAPVVWETNAQRRKGALGYNVVDPADDDRRDYRSIYDVSGDATLLDTLIGRSARGGEIVLAGFYEGAIKFDFAPAFMRETRVRIAAEWRPEDLHATAALVESGLSLDGLITHRATAADAANAYPTAFGDPECLKMILDWRGMA